jgi:hypothetical protein
MIQTQYPDYAVDLAIQSKYDQMSTEDLVALANADLEPVMDPLELVRSTRRSLGRKFEVSDITHSGDAGQELYDAACEWLKTQEAQNHSLEFVRKVAIRYLHGGGLTDGQAKGILNCMSAVRPSRDDRGYGPSIEKMNRLRNRLTEDDDDKAYDAWLEAQMSAIGMGYYTVVHQDGSHTTIKIGKWGADKSRPGRKIRWIHYLVGPNNESDYQWFARQGDGEGYVIAPKYRMEGKLGTALRVIFHEGGSEEAQHAYALDSSRCARCNRVLTVPASLYRGLGPECAKKGGL